MVTFLLHTTLYNIIIYDLPGIFYGVRMGVVKVKFQNIFLYFCLLANITIYVFIVTYTESHKFLYEFFGKKFHQLR